MSKQKPKSVPKFENKVNVALEKAKKEVVALVPHVESPVWRKAFWIAAIVFTVIRCFLSFDYGISSDERFYKNHGDLTYDYFTSLGTQDSVLRYNPDGVLINYGPMIDLFGTATYKAFGLDDFQGRHLFITLFCALLFIGCGLVAKEVAGWRAGLIALIFITLSPRIFGEAMNNAKDAPFAAAYIFTIYQVFRFVKQLPNPTWKMSLWLAIGIGLCIGIRAGGLIIIPYTLLFCGVEVLFRKELRAVALPPTMNFIKNTGGKLAATFVAGYFLGIIFWPYALTKPFTQVFAALKSLTNSPVLIKTLFEGAAIQSSKIPWYYVSKYIFITTPIIILLLLVAGIFMLPVLRKYFTLRHMSMLLFFGIFPILYVIYQKSYFYNGWRHTYFTYVPLAAFAAVTLEGLLRMYTKPTMQYAIYGLVAIGLISPLRFMASNHPNEYTYYNEFTGGVSGTLGEYEPDYFANTVKQAMEWIAKNEDLSKPVIIASNHGFQVEYYGKKLSPNITAIYTPYRDRYEKDWDYAILLQSFVDPYMLKKGYFTPKYGLVHTIKADNMPLCVILKRTNKNDVQGIEAVKKGDFVNGITLLTSAQKENPDNEAVNYYLGIGLASVGKVVEGEAFVREAIRITPNNTNYLITYAMICLNSNKTDDAIATIAKVLKDNPDYLEGYNLMAKAYSQKGDAASAARYQGIYNANKR